jgi:hypothetical protein
MELSDATEIIPTDTTGDHPGTCRLVAQSLNHYALKCARYKGQNNYKFVTTHCIEAFLILLH